MENTEEFLVEDGGSESSDESLELIIDKVPTEEEREDEAQNILNYDIESFVDKPWNKPGADITDYFNYGFNETTWKEYCSMQKKKSEFAMGGPEWTDEKYVGVRRGFNEIKRDDGPKDKGRRMSRDGKSGDGRWRKDARGRKEGQDGRNWHDEDRGDRRYKKR